MMPPASRKPAVRRARAAQHKKDLAAAQEKGRGQGLRDALLVLGLGLGLGVAAALSPPKCPRCGHGSHEGDCPPERLTP